MHHIAKPPLRPDVKAIPHQQHPDQQFGIDRWATGVAAEFCKMSADAGQINKTINRPHQVIMGERDPLTRTRRTMLPARLVSVPSSPVLSFVERIESVAQPTIKEQFFNKISPL